MTSAGTIKSRLLFCWPGFPPSLLSSPTLRYLFQLTLEKAARPSTLEVFPELSKQTQTPLGVKPRHRSVSPLSAHLFYRLPPYIITVTSPVCLSQQTELPEDSDWVFPLGRTPWCLHTAPGTHVGLCWAHLFSMDEQSLFSRDSVTSQQTTTRKRGGTCNV